MSAFAQDNFDASKYSQSRPTYPDSFFDKIVAFHQAGKDGQFNRVVDLGCGPGEASLPMLDKFDEVIATDVSGSMIKKAQANFDKKSAELRAAGKHVPKKVTVALSASEDLSKILPSPSQDGSVDLVTAAECVHWFDWDKWLTEMVRVIKKDGTLAFFSYVDPIFIDYPELQEFYEETVYESGDFLGPYWQQPGRGYLRGKNKLINEIVLKDDRFYDVKVVYYDPLVDTAGLDDKMVISKDWTVQTYLDYIDTWSSSHNWNQAHPGRDASELLYQELKRRTGWKKEQKIRIAWQSVYCFARVK